MGNLKKGFLMCVVLLVLCLYVLAPDPFGPLDDIIAGLLAAYIESRLLSS